MADVREGKGFDLNKLTQLLQNMQIRTSYSIVCILSKSCSIGLLKIALKCIKLRKSMNKYTQIEEMHIQKKDRLYSFVF